MNVNLSNQLKEKYPQQFSQLKYIECGDGWYDLLDKLCNIIQNRIDFNLKQGNESNFYWAQIKEKFGGLRAYCYGADEYMSGAISMAETMSYMICEFSGERGRLRKQRKGDNSEPIFAWWKTLSDNEAEKEGYL
jgi:hypothetical protein